MHSLIKKRTITQIIASRKSNRQQKDTRLLSSISFSTQMEATNEFKMQHFLKKSSYNNEDKLMLLRYLQKRYRLRFDNAFSNTPMDWIIVREKRIIEKHFDSSKKSYYLLRGRISICERVHSVNALRETQSSGDGQVKVKKYEEVSAVEGQKGIGALFSTQHHHKALLMCQNSLILQIEHPNDELTLVQRNCIMTTDEKETFVKNFGLFKKLDNINKYYTPFFHVKRYQKGDMVYQIGQSPLFLYLIVEGQVEFQSRVPQHVTQQGQAAISKLILKNTFQNFILITTEILGRGNYFGEEEILEEATRKQNARCISLSAIIIEVPLDKLNKLLFYNDFRETLQSSSLTKAYQRVRKVQNFMTYRGPQPSQPPSDKKLQSIGFQQFNEAIFNSCSDRPSQRHRLSLKDHRTKILHGSALKLYPQSHAKNQSFSMLQVNAQMYDSSLKKFRSFSMEQKKRNKQKEGKGKEGKGRSLRQIWRVLKLQKVIQEEERVGIENSQGKAYFHAHLRLTKHIKDVKSYRPKTIASNCRVKTQFVEYLQHIL